MSEPIMYARDLDGTGSLHPCSKGDDGAIPLYTTPSQGQTQRDLIEGLDEAIAFFTIDNGNSMDEEIISENAASPYASKQLKRIIEAARRHSQGLIGAVPEGYKLVQMEASLEQRMAGMKAWDAHMKARKAYVSWVEMMDIVWQAMIAAASPPTETTEEE